MSPASSSSSPASAPHIRAPHISTSQDASASPTIATALAAADERWGTSNHIWQRGNDGFAPKTFHETRADTEALAASLIAAGLGTKQIMVYGENSYEWAIADFAIMGYVGVNVSVSERWDLAELERTLGILDVAAIIYAESKREMVEALKASPALQTEGIVFISLQDDLPRLLEQGRRLLTDEAHPLEFEPRDPNAVCKIMFSSGTTAQPKASMLSQRNLFSGWQSLKRRAPLSHDDVCYLVLPIYHTYGGVYNLLYSLLGGWQVYLSSGPAHMVAEMRLIRPTGLSAVPLLLKRIYDAIDPRTLKRINVARKLSNFLLRLGIDVRAILFKQLHEVFGGKLAYLFCAGDPLDRELKRFFRETGFNIMEAYALTEVASSLCLEYPATPHLDGVGTVYEEVEVRIDSPDANGLGEILVRGENVCLGYYNNPQANARAFDEQGYFHTGDLGYLKGGILYLAGRK
jgi:long-chain acyl-CoA synthetase